MDEYKDALGIGLRQYRKAIHQNENPYPAVLSKILETEKSEGERGIGIVEIPLDLIVGTKEEGRSNAFSREFYPLLEEKSEFAAKWTSLFQYQIDEGIQDAIKVYEYKTRFYVEEGNKRVSVAKFLKMPSILASVIRVMPEKNDSLESKKYYEFFRFYEKYHSYQILFSKYGNYEKLLKLLGKTWEDEFTEDEIMHLNSVFYNFSIDFLKLNPDAEPEKIGDGFLAFLEIMPYEEIKEKSSEEIKKDIQGMKPELKQGAGEDEVVRVLEPEEIKQSLVDKLFSTGKKQVKVAFIYKGDPKTSDWMYAHELGRLHVDEALKDRVLTAAYQSDKDDPDGTKALEAAVRDENDVIFATSPDMMPAEIKVALKSPNIYFYNCSVNFSYKTVQTYYVRMYEAKFLTGLLAGVLAKTEDIGYEAGYPIYGTVAEINAFALGVQMVNPDAKIHLSWACLEGSSQKEEEDKGFIISAKENITSTEGRKSYGLYRKEGDTVVRYAAAIINWGKFYEKMLSMVLDGTLNPSAKEAKTINYWWGMRSEVIDIVMANSIPPRLRVLVEEFHSLLKRNEYHPFEGEILDQNGKIHGEDGGILSNEEIITMNWLNSNVVGSIPNLNELTGKGAALAEVQGVQWEEM